MPQGTKSHTIQVKLPMVRPERQHLRTLVNRAACFNAIMTVVSLQPNIPPLPPPTSVPRVDTQLTVIDCNVYYSPEPKIH